MEKIVSTLADLELEASRFIASLTLGAEATLVTLSGELGAGKTAFTKAVARTLGVEETVTSPTFVLEKIYELPEGQVFTRLIHIDAYRLEKGSDLTPLHFDDYRKDPRTLILLEWPEKVADALPTPTKHLTLSLNTDGSRTITYD